jgi:hypothetical protein
MNQISIVGNYHICRHITPNGEFDLTIWTWMVDGKLFYHRIISAEAWKSIVPDFTMDEMLQIINVCICGDDFYSMKLSRNKQENEDCIDMNFILKERIKTYTFGINVPYGEISELNNMKFWLHDLKKELSEVIVLRSQIKDDYEGKFNDLIKTIEDREHKYNSLLEANVNRVQDMLSAFEKKSNALFEDRISYIQNMIADFNKHLETRTIVQSPYEVPKAGTGYAMRSYRPAIFYKKYKK